MKNKTNQTSLEDLRYYFDAQGKECRDYVTHSDRVSDWNIMRRRLGGLPNHLYKVATKAIFALLEVSENQMRDLPEKKSSSESEKAAKQLFEQIKN